MMEFGAGWTAACILVTATVGYYIIFLATVWYRKAFTKLPPCNYGRISLPFIGCAVEFGKGPLMYVRRMQEEMGAVFTLYIGGKRMTYLTDEEDYEKYFMQSSAEHVDFQKAVYLFVANAASITPRSFLAHHTAIHDMMKGKLAIANVPPFGEDLELQFERRLQEVNPSGRVELNDLIRSIMYPAVIRNLFGKSVLPIDDDKLLNRLKRQFVAYDDQFEYGTQIPQFFLREWAESKRWLLDMFNKAMTRLQPNDDTLLKSLYDTVDEEHAANYSLLMLWASLANAIPITFWTVAYILRDENIKEKVEKTIQSALDERGQLVFNAQTSEKLKYIKQCYLEAIRVRSPGVITRMVVKPFDVKGYQVPAGDLLFLSPYWTHRNEKYFPDPETFRPERYASHDFTKASFPRGFVAFGGGRYMCPGRWYAQMELLVIVSMLFHKYDMSLTQGCPPPNVMHMVGVQQPDKECFIDIKPRKAAAVN